MYPLATAAVQLMSKSLLLAVTGLDIRKYQYRTFRWTVIFISDVCFAFTRESWVLATKLMKNSVGLSVKKWEQEKEGFFWQSKWWNKRHITVRPVFSCHRNSIQMLSLPWYFLYLNFIVVDMSEDTKMHTAAQNGMDACTHTYCSIYEIYRFISVSHENAHAHICTVAILS